MIMFLPISLTCVLGAQKNGLIETALLSTHNICFGREIRKKMLHSLIWGPVKGSKQYEPLIRQRAQSDLGPYSLQYKLL